MATPSPPTGGRDLHRCLSVPDRSGQRRSHKIRGLLVYRKLGFRPGRTDLLALAEQEEKRISRDPGHHTSPRTLRKLAEGHMFFEFGNSPGGRWDRFSTRTLGLAVQRRMAAEFDGDAGKMRRTT